MRLENRNNSIPFGCWLYRFPDAVVDNPIYDFKRRRFFCCFTFTRHRNYKFCSMNVFVRPIRINNNAKIDRPTKNGKIGKI